ncbi:hypothetical protein [Pseudaestuariivita rosea]|uniref:hypothetical protein n=1 Tax=Pseudaestuariivita rosea TaxID=2763263 RepID=UPI001ABBB4C4|nr:hypothetical protein [Pseudaestuariivita rosea]
MKVFLASIGVFLAFHARADQILTTATVDWNADGHDDQIRVVRNSDDPALADIEFFIFSIADNELDKIQIIPKFLPASDGISRDVQLEATAGGRGVELTQTGNHLGAGTGYWFQRWTIALQKDAFVVTSYVNDWAIGFYYDGAEGCHIDYASGDGVFYHVAGDVMLEGSFQVLPIRDWQTTPLPQKCQEEYVTIVYYMSSHTKPPDQTIKLDMNGDGRNDHVILDQSYYTLFFVTAQPDTPAQYMGVSHALAWGRNVNGQYQTFGPITRAEYPELISHPEKSDTVLLNTYLTRDIGSPLTLLSVEIAWKENRPMITQFGVEGRHNTETHADKGKFSCLYNFEDRASQIRHGPPDVAPIIGRLDAKRPFMLSEWGVDQVNTYISHCLDS